MTFLLFIAFFYAPAFVALATEMLFGILGVPIWIEAVEDGVEVLSWTPLGEELLILLYFIYMVLFIYWYNFMPSGVKLKLKIRAKREAKKAAKEKRRQDALELQRNRIYLMELERDERRDNEVYRKGLQKIERDKMTPKLRAEILQRDFYRCQMCGRSAKDGVKLEVDHKIPIAKGGKTEISNLWTLCFDCNRAKSDKIIDLSEFE